MTDSIEVVWIDNSESFAQISRAWKSKELLAIDTEFERRTTYYPKLALVQVFDGEKIFLIDPLKVECPDEFREICRSSEIVKVIHSAKEDLETLFYSWQCKFNQLFDTQVAYAFLKGESSKGYAALVESYCHIIVDKEETQSDWLVRPLQQTQLQYASKDVEFLLTLFEQLDESLREREFYQLFVSECDEICNNIIKPSQPEIDYRNAKGVCKLNGIQLVLFKQLFKWREMQAIENNRTRNHIFRDNQLVDIALMQPLTKKALQNIEGVHPRSLRLYSEAVLGLVSEFDSGTGEPLLPVVPNSRDVSGHKRLTEQLLGRAGNIAGHNGIPPSLLLSKRMARKIATSYLTQENQPAIWSGWRKRLLQTDFEQISSEFSG